MTNEQAIEWLKGLKANEILTATKEALDMAIQALEQNSCKTCRYYSYAFDGYPCVNCCRNFKLVDEIREQKNDLWKDGASNG